MTVFCRTSQFFLAAFAPVHKLLPVHPSRNLNVLDSILRAAGIGKVVFLRHGKTAPSAGTDFERSLTEEGRSQARQAGLVFGRGLNPYFSKALISPAPRTTETAEIYLSSADAHATLLPIDILYDGTMQPKGSELFRKIGYAPLSSYLENDNDDIRIPSQLVLGSYANSCVESIIEQVSASTLEDASPSNRRFCTLLVVGHAVYLPAAALAVSNLLDCQDSENTILQTNTREAEGYLVDRHEKSVKHLSRDE
jgi:hypothetical protein